MSGKRFFPLIRKIVHLCGSLRIALSLMFLLLILCGWGTFIELDFGTPAASLLIYRNPFFRFLILLFGVNILAAVFDRIPWKKSHVPFLCAHLGVLLLLVGCWATSRFAVEGKMTVTEGTSASSILLGNSREIVVEHPTMGQKETSRVSIPFFGGPFNLADRTSRGWNQDVYRPALNAVPPKRGFFAALSRFCFKVHYTLTGLLLRYSKGPVLSGVPNGIPELRQIEIIDYRVHADFRPSPRLSMIIAKRQEDRTEREEVVFDFENPEKRSSDVVLSQRGIRRRLKDGKRVIFTTVDSSREAESLLRLATTETCTADDSDKTTFFQLALNNGENVTRLSFEDLFRYIPDYSDSEKFANLSPEADIDLGRGWSLTRIEIVPTMVPGLETIQGWTARLELSHRETGAFDRLQLSSEWHERDIQGTVSGIVGSLFGTIPERTQNKILSREWDESLSEPLIELIQSPDGALSCRYWDGKERVTTTHAQRNPDGKFLPIELADGESLQIEEFTPQDEFGGVIATVPYSKETADEFYAKVRLRVKLQSDSGKVSTETFWLRAVPVGMTGVDESVFSRTLFDADGGIYRFRLACRNSDLGFSIHVKNFKPVYEPGASISSSFSSTVDYLPGGKNGGVDREKERDDVLIKMNHPGIFYSPTHRLSYWTYQDSYRGPFFPGNPVFDQTAGGKLLPGESCPRNEIYQTVLSLNADPGRGPKYLGSFLIVFGTALLFFRKRLAQTTALLILATELTFMSCPVMAAETETLEHKTQIDWTAWRLLPVFDEGRVMPLNSYAVMTVKEICGTDTPLIRVSPRLLEALDSGTAVSFLPLDAFLAGRNVSQKQREELERAYGEIKKQKADTQKRAAARIRQLIGEGRKFSAHELLFSWLVEPDVWEYIPFIADPDQTLHNLMARESSEESDAGFLSPAQLRGTRSYADRIDVLAAGGTREYPDWESAVREGKIDRACAMAEGRLSRFDALVFWPARGKIAAAEDELDGLLYPRQENRQTEQFTLLEELNLAVLELKQFSDRERENLDSPFDDKDFYPGQTVELGTGGRKVEVLVLINDLHRIAGEWQTDRYQENQIRLREISEKLRCAERRLVSWRDCLFSEGKGSVEFRKRVVGLSRLLTLVTEKVEKASCECVIGQWKTAVSVSDKTRIQPIPGTEKCLASPSARFAPRGAGALSILPNPESKVNANGLEKDLVWFPIQSILWDASTLSSENKRVDSNQHRDFSPVEGLREKIDAEGEDSGPAVRAFSDAAQGYLSDSPDRGGLVTRSLIRFSDEIRRMSESNSSGVQVTYPAVGALNAEYNYFRLDPFWGLWFFSLLAFLFLSLSMIFGKGGTAKAAFSLGVFFLLIAVVITAIGGGLRAYITGWAPVTNMFETVVLLAFLVLIVTLCYAFVPLLGSKVLWAWNQSDGSIRFRLIRRSVRFLLTVLLLWIAVWICYHEQGSEIGIWKAFVGSFAAQGMLDQAAVLATLGILVWFFPRFFISLFLLPFAPRMPDSERRELMTKVLDRRLFVILGALVAFLIGLLAYYNTAEFNPNIKPLTAVLRSNFWLTVHVLAIMFSYALGALAWIVSLVTLSGALFGHLSDDGTEPLLCARYKIHILTLLRFAVLFLTLGIILGARWADFSWGRFWSWDPKEVWALVTLLIYLFVLHRDRRGLSLPLGGLLGGLSILMTWYGLSFVFGGGGRHSYAAGESNRTAVLYILVAANLIYGMAAWSVFQIRKRRARRNAE